MKKSIRKINTGEGNGKGSKKQKKHKRKNTQNILVGNPEEKRSHRDSLKS